MFSYSSPLASWIENNSGVAKCLRASALSSSRMTSTANRVDWRIFWSSSRLVALVRHQRHLARLAADRPDQEVALAVDGAEAPLLDLEQLVGDAGGLQAVAEIGGEHRSSCRSASFGSRQNRLLT